MSVPQPRRLKIGLDLLFLLPGISGGMQTHAVSLLNALAALDKVNEYHVFLNREAGALEWERRDNFTFHIASLAATNRPLRYMWEQLVLPVQARRIGLDVLHAVGYVGPLAVGCKTVVTIPDLNFVALGNTMAWQRRTALEFFASHAGRRADHIFTDSVYSKKSIQKYLNIPSHKITVAYLGARVGAINGEAGAWQALAQGYGIRGPYVAALGGLSVHKNIQRLLEAFARLQASFPHQLVLIGQVPPDVNTDIMRALGDRLVVTGYVSDETLKQLLAHADLFVFPSWYEGFGLPVLEAQAAGAPVACSNACSLPEVAGESAVFFDPYSADDMARAIRECLGDADLRRRLREKGAANHTRFSWADNARTTLAVYRQVANA